MLNNFVMNKESNAYTFGFTIVMIVVVALGLAVTSITLKPLQERNVLVEKKQNILQSLNVNVDFEKVEKTFKDYIKATYIVKPDGSYNEGNVFDINLKEELKKPLQERNLPLYVAEKDGHKFFVIPLYGKGLWGPIWGYIALKEDLNTVYGVSFGHKGETPGLGAEIVNDKFKNKFKEKKLFDEQGNFVSIKVNKGAKSLSKHEVDAISGATITSKGLEKMIYNVLKDYVNFFKNYKKNK